MPPLKTGSTEMGKMLCNNPPPTAPFELSAFLRQHLAPASARFCFAPQLVNHCRLCSPTSEIWQAMLGFQHTQKKAIPECAVAISSTSFADSSQVFSYFAAQCHAGIHTQKHGNTNQSFSNLKQFTSVHTDAHTSNFAMSPHAHPHTPPKAHRKRTKRGRVS
jgi:hypothetical protein